MGSAAAWSLAQSGHEVLLLERFSPGHVQGASHGATRNFNPAYSEPEYVRLLKRSNVLWDEISSLAGTELLKRTGLVNHGIVAEQHAMHTALSRAGFDSELLGISEAEDRFAGMKFETEVLHVPLAARSMRILPSLPCSSLPAVPEQRSNMASESPRFLFCPRTALKSASTTALRNSASVPVMPSALSAHGPRSCWALLFIFPRSM